MVMVLKMIMMTTTSTTLSTVYFLSHVSPEPVHPEISGGEKVIQLFRRGAEMIDVGSQLTTVVENGVLIRCNVTGKPTPRIQWKKDGQPLNISSPEYVLMSLSLGDSGLYTCSASNILGSVEVTSNIRVTCKS